MTMLDYFQFTPTQDQSKILKELQKFCSLENDDDFIIIKGSAGTGKTSILKASTDYLLNSETECKLCAPTGRAAKIISQKTGTFAYTIHSTIYKVIDNDFNQVHFERKQNKDGKFTIYFVDESSMISDANCSNGLFKSPGSLLQDLIGFIKEGNSKNKIVFIGDAYQLAPVVPMGHNQEGLSPALEQKYLEVKYSLKGQTVEMNEVMRQKKDNPILELATQIRSSIANQSTFNHTLPTVYKPTYALNKYLSETDLTKVNSSVVICNTNKDVKWWNSAIRNKLGHMDSLNVSDHVMVQQTVINSCNTWINGEAGIITGVDKSIETFANLMFQNVIIKASDLCGEEKEYSTKVLLDSLSTYNGRLQKEKEKHLFHEVMRLNATFRSSKKISDDPYLSALRLKHSYAITCHKAQGGEWKNVIIHPFRIYSDLRWLYTAVTRAVDTVTTY